MRLKNLANLVFIAFCINSMEVNNVIAGTSQIFSPAGLPRSSTQDYSIPDTTVTPQTFPTPPIPMGGEASLQAFSSVPLKEELTNNGSKSASQSASVSNPQLDSSIGGGGSVASFFQCPSVPNGSDLQITKKTKSDTFNLGKLMWHTLDNLGVPMAAPKDEDLDPSLRANCISQPLSGQKNVKPIHQKIPDSELGVTDINEKDDTKLH